MLKSLPRLNLPGLWTDGELVLSVEDAEYELMRHKNTKSQDGLWPSFFDIRLLELSLNNIYFCDNEETIRQKLAKKKINVAPKNIDFIDFIHEICRVIKPYDINDIVQSEKLVGYIINFYSLNRRAKTENPINFPLIVAFNLKNVDFIDLLRPEYKRLKQSDGGLFLIKDDIDFLFAARLLCETYCKLLRYEVVLSELSKKDRKILGDEFFAKQISDLASDSQIYSDNKISSVVAVRAVEKFLETEKFINLS